MAHEKETHRAGRDSAIAEMVDRHGNVTPLIGRGFRGPGVYEMISPARPIRRAWLERFDGVAAVVVWRDNPRNPLAVDALVRLRNAAYPTATVVVWEGDRDGAGRRAFVDGPEGRPLASPPSAPEGRPSPRSKSKARKAARRGKTAAAADPGEALAARMALALAGLAGD